MSHEKSAPNGASFSAIAASESELGFAQVTTKKNNSTKITVEGNTTMKSALKVAFATKDMEVTHLGCATVHQLVTGCLLMHSEIDPVRNIARGIHRLSPVRTMCGSRTGRWSLPCVMSD